MESKVIVHRGVVEAGEAILKTQERATRLKYKNVPCSAYAPFSLKALPTDFYKTVSRERFMDAAVHISAMNVSSRVRYAEPRLVLRRPQQKGRCAPIPIPTPLLET